MCVSCDHSVRKREKQRESERVRARREEDIEEIRPKDKLANISVSSRTPCHRLSSIETVSIPGS